MHNGVGPPRLPDAKRAPSALRAFFSPIAFSTPWSVCGKALGQERARMAMYCAVHSPTPGRLRSRSSVVSTSAPGSSTRPAADTARASDTMALARAAITPISPRSEGFQRCHALGRREQPAQRGDRCLHRFAERGGKATGQRPGGLHRDLLPEDCAHRELEAVEGARQPQPRDSALRVARARARCRRDCRTGRTTASRAPAQPERPRRATRTSAARSRICA